MCDPTDLGRHACGNYDCKAGPGRDRRAHEGHVAAISKRKVDTPEGVGLLVNRLGFAGQGCFGATQRGSL